MAVNMKLGVEMGEFTQNINNAKAQIKSFDAALKFAESSFKATGDAEAQMVTKTSALTSKLQQQQRIVKEYSRVLAEARNNGIDPMSDEYKKLEAQMISAQAAMMDTQAALNGLSTSQVQAATSADKLATSVGNIGKKISLEQVINGIDRITGGLERAAQRAVTFAKELWDGVMDSAARADDISTAAIMYDIPLQRYKQMLALEARGLDTSVSAMLAAQKKLGKGIGGDNKTAAQALKDLQVSLKKLEDTGGGILEFVDKDPEEAFFEIGKALYEMGKGYDKEAAAQALFGRSWEELMPLFEKYKTLDEYNAALKEMNTTTDKATENAAELNDRVGALENTWTTLKDEIVGAVAPGLTEAAEALDGMLSAILEYLQSPAGQEALTKLGESVAGLFNDLSEIDPDKVVNNFIDMFNKLKESFEWIKDNWGSVKTGLKSIFGVWAGGKVMSGALTILQLINGLKGLTPDAAGGVTEITTALGGKLAFNGIESTLGTSIGSHIVSALTSTPLTVAIAAASIVAIAHGVYTAINSKNPLEEALVEMGNTPEEAKAKAEAWDKAAQADFWTNPEGRKKAMDLLHKGLETGDWSVEPVPVETELVVENDAADLAEQVGTVTVPVNLRVNLGGATGAPGGGGGLMDFFEESIFGGSRRGFANGIPWVNDTQLAMLHRGERVLTARENRQYTINNNTYFGGVNLHNRMEVDALTESIDRQNRRQQAAYGA